MPQLISIFAISLVIVGSALGANKLELEPGASALIEADTQTEVSCKKGDDHVRSATIFAGTILYTGANCDSLEVMPNRLAKTVTVKVNDFHTVRCEDENKKTKSYNLAFELPVENKSNGEIMHVQALVSVEDLILHQ
ncbi:MAG: hypothetical protein KDD51_16795 [Bdellovibrionales bacterium]|nr:hypothetical protein [Bdellovibrionales bacterium]